jgi:DUF971 family protein
MCPCAAVFRGEVFSAWTSSYYGELCAHVPRFLKGKLFLLQLAVTTEIHMPMCRGFKRGSIFCLKYQLLQRVMCPCAVVFGGKVFSAWTSSYCRELCAHVPRFLKGKLFLLQLAVTTESHVPMCCGFWRGSIFCLKYQLLQRVMCPCAAVFGGEVFTAWNISYYRESCAHVPRFL